MTIEESVRNNPGKFQTIINTKEPEVREALNELSAKLDVSFNGVINEYCDAEGCEVKIEDIPDYKTMNRLITGKIDELVKEHIRNKRGDI